MPPKKQAERPAILTVECTVANVHLGDGRKLAKGERAEVPAALADALIAKKQARLV